MRGGPTIGGIAIHQHAIRLATAAAVLVVLAGCTSRVEGSATTGESSTTGSGTAETDSGSRSEPTPEGADGEFQPTEDDQDPSKRIEGVVVTEYDNGHAELGQRVAYEKAPPDGGRHAPVWADCNGAVYPVAVRNEEMVHSLEHGAIWIAYEPGAVAGADLERLVERVDGVPYMMLSPYPGIDAPVAVQAWGHQLKLDDPADPRIDQFVEALRTNEYTSPEPGARCDSQGTGFDLTNPPPLDTTPPGPDAAPVTGR